MREKCTNSETCEKLYDPELCDVGFRSCYQSPPHRLKLQEITDAVRRGESPNYEDLRYATIAYDVLTYLLKLDTDVTRLTEYFKAAESIPLEYIGPDNDPVNPLVIEWAKAMQGIK